MHQTPTTRLATLLLGVDLSEWVATRRANGMPWADISRELHKATDGQAGLSHEWLRQKFGIRDSGGAVPPADRRTA